MITTPIACVVDASVGVKQVVTEVDSVQARALFAHVTRDPAARFVVPDLFYLECANVFRTLTVRGVLSQTDAELNFAALEGLPLQVEAARPLAREALLLGLAHGLSAYDAVYVALSAHLNLPLITADDRLVRKLASTGFSVLLLSSLTIPAPPP
jgi:predicted nucleic acid-binding protein